MHLRQVVSVQQGQSAWCSRRRAGGAGLLASTEGLRLHSTPPGRSSRAQAAQPPPVLAAPASTSSGAAPAAPALPPPWRAHQSAGPLFWEFGGGIAWHVLGFRTRRPAIPAVERSPRRARAIASRANAGPYTGFFARETEAQAAGA